MTFLEQLQESAGLLNNQISNTDTTQIKNLFGNYNPNLASDYVATPFGQPIAQNRFLGNQFQMPNLSGQTYTPGAMAPGTGFNLPYNPAPYNPGFFNEYGNVAQTGNIPSNVSTTTTMNDRGGNGPNQDPFSGRFESFGDQTFSIDEDGNIKPVTGTPFTTPLLGLLSGIGKLVPGEEARRFEGLDENTQRQLFGLLDDETKNALAGSKYNMNVDNNVTRDYLNRDIISQLAPEQQKELLKTDVERDIVNKRSGYGLFGIGSPSEAERAKALQEQQNAIDLQKQADKNRQAMDARSKAAGLNAARERQKAKDKAQRDKQKGGNPNRGERNAGGR